MEDEDGEVERCCRICRGPEEEEVDGEEAGEALGKLIRPCACKGSLLYVHEVPPSHVLSIIHFNPLHPLQSFASFDY